jgi:predicted RNase H-related nuclease YkuK (DUF458 family)
MEWISPTKGQMSIDDVINEIVEYTNSDRFYDYELRVGTDSQRHGGYYTFVTTIVIRKIGNGGRYFTYKYTLPKMALEQRMWEEALASLKVAEELAQKLLTRKLPPLHMRVDLDLGDNGWTKQLIKPITGMVLSYGFNTEVQPEASIAAT